MPFKTAAMAILTGGPSFTGSMGDITAYRMKGVDRIILRLKGGASKEKIKNHPNFDLVRKNNEEWKGCVLAMKSVSRAVHSVKHLADYNYSGVLQSICKSIQSGDGVYEKGKRPVVFSQQLYKLDGFSFNRYNYFDTILRHPLQCSVDRNNGSAIIELPQLIPGINLQNPKGEPFYRIIFTLGAVSDIVYNAERKMYCPVTTDLPHSVTSKSNWYNQAESCPGQTINLPLTVWQPAGDISLLVAAGVEFGRPFSSAEIRAVKYAGAAKILKMI